MLRKAFVKTSTSVSALFRDPGLGVQIGALCRWRKTSRNGPRRSGPPTLAYVPRCENGHDAEHRPECDEARARGRRSAGPRTWRARTYALCWRLGFLAAFGSGGVSASSDSITSVSANHSDSSVERRCLTVAYSAIAASKPADSA